MEEQADFIKSVTVILSSSQISKQRGSKCDVWLGKEAKSKHQQRRRTRVTKKLFCKSYSIEPRHKRNQGETFQDVREGRW